MTPGPAPDWDAVDPWGRRYLVGVYDRTAGRDGASVPLGIVWGRGHARLAQDGYIGRVSRAVGGDAVRLTDAGRDWCAAHADRVHDEVAAGGGG